MNKKIINLVFFFNLYICRSIVNDLKYGKFIYLESFDCVFIFFSDIV